MVLVRVIILLKSIIRHIQAIARTKENYIAPMYQEIINSCEEVYLRRVDTKNVKVSGTPVEYEELKYEYE